MTRKHLDASLAVFAAFFLFAACGEEPEGNGDNGNGNGEENGENGENGGNGEEILPGESHLLKVFMHDGITKIYLSDMTVTADAVADDYDIHVDHTDGPDFVLGHHVQAINLGNEVAFHEIEELPETGYEPDGASSVIGTSYRSGGAGSTGYIMSENVYALRLDYDGEITYAKIEVLQAHAGEVHVLAFRQTDGSLNVLTNEESVIE